MSSVLTDGLPEEGRTKKGRPDEGLTEEGRTAPPDALSAEEAAQLAAAHGLAVSGARPGPVAYAQAVWSRRHFITAFATARLTAAYTAARLGQVWQVMTPLLNAGVYYLIFGMLLRVNHGIANFVPYLCVGVFIFGFTQSAVLAGTRSISDNLGLIRALHFPRACLPISTTLQQLQQLGFSLSVLLVIVVACGEPLSPRVVLLVPALALQSVFNTGLALFMARIGAQVTDMAQLMPFILRTWLYFSGVFYDLKRLVHHAPVWSKTLLDCNPALIYIDLVRYALMPSMKAHQLPPHIWIMAIVWAVVSGIGGYLFFWKAEEEYGRG